VVERQKLHAVAKYRDGKLSRHCVHAMRTHAQRNRLLRRIEGYAVVRAPPACVDPHMLPAAQRSVPLSASLPPLCCCVEHLYPAAARPGGPATRRALLCPPCAAATPHHTTS